MALSSVKIQRATARILIFDVERIEGHASVRFWDRGQFKNGWFPSDCVITPPRIICYGARWYGEDEIMLRGEWERGGHRKLITDLWQLIEAADITVTHNGDRADLPWFRESLPQYGLKFPKPPKSVDTYKVMRQAFPSYHSKSMVETAKFLGVPLGKVGHWSRALADAAAAKDPDAIAELMEYQAGDVILQGAVYDALRGYIPNHPHITTDGDTKVCNQCGSLDLKPNGDALAVVQLRAAYRCRNCGANVSAGHIKRVAASRGLR